MACDSSHFRSGVVPLAFFRMMRDEKRWRQVVSMSRENGAEGTRHTVLAADGANNLASEEAIPSNIVPHRHAHGR